MTLRNLSIVQSENGHDQDESETLKAQVAPSNPEAEEATLGSIEINHNIIHDLKAWLRPEHFFILKNRWIYEAMLSIAERDEDIDSVVLAEELRTRNQLSKVGGIPYLISLANNTPTHIHYDSYARIVKEAWRRRRCLHLAGEIAQCSVTFDSAGAESIRARRLIDEMRELMSQPYDPKSDGLVKDLVDVKDLDSRPDPTWLIKAEIPDKCLTIIFGPSGVGKSFFAFDLALRLSQEYRGLYCMAEGETGAKRRVRAWTYHNHLAPGDLKFYMNVAALLVPSERNAFQTQIIERVRPRFIIIDTFAHFMLPGDENNNRDMGTFMRIAKEIQKEYDCAVILIHHTNKGGLIERGGGSMRAAADSMIRLMSEDDIISVECSKAKDEKEFPTRYIRLLPVQVDIDEDDQPVYSPVVIAAEKVEQQKHDDPTNQQRLILETLADVFTFGAPVNELAETTHVSRGSLFKALSRMRKLGWITQEERGDPYAISDDGLSMIGRSRRGDKDSTKTPSGNEFTANLPSEFPSDNVKDSKDSKDSMITEGEESENSAGKQGDLLTTASGRQEQPGKFPVNSTSLESKKEFIAKRRKELTAEVQQKIADGICPVCDRSLEKTRKGNQCPDCKAVWSH